MLSDLLENPCNNISQPEAYLGSSRQMEAYFYTVPVYVSYRNVPNICCIHVPQYFIAQLSKERRPVGVPPNLPEVLIDRRALRKWLFKKNALLF